MLWRFLLFLALFSMGCAHKTAATQSLMPAPMPGTREALLPTYEPTGSACLDSIVVNMLYMGCSNVQVAATEDGMMYMGCVSAQPGAQDVFSRGTFIRTVHPDALPDGAQPFCGDPTGIYAMWNVPFSELRRNE